MLPYADVCCRTQVSKAEVAGHEDAEPVGGTAEESEGGAAAGSGEHWPPPKVAEQEWAEYIEAFRKVCVCVVGVCVSV